MHAAFVFGLRIGSIIANASIGVYDVDDHHRTLTCSLPQNTVNRPPYRLFMFVYGAVVKQYLIER